MAASAVALVPASSAQKAVVDEAISHMMEEWRAPGAVVAVVDQGEVVHRAAYGFANVESREPVVFETTVFRLASLSKPVTAMAVMKLHELGHISLDEPIGPRLSDLDMELEPGTSLRHLLTHTAGLEDRFLLRFAPSVAELGPLADYLAESLPTQRYQPGEVSLYSNHGMALAGLVASRVYGRSFEETMSELVFDPLQLESASYDPRTAEEHLAQGYRFGESVPVMGIRTVPASMLVASGADMLRIMLALLAPQDKRVLDPETVELMLSRQFSHHPELTGRALGWSEDSSGPTRRLLHSGATDGFTSALVLLPERRGGVFVATNANVWVWGAVRKILDEVLEVDVLEAGANSAHQSDAVATSADSVPEPDLPWPGRYVPAQVPVRSLDKPRLLFEQARVSAVADQVTFRGRRYAPAKLRGEDGWLTEDGAILIAGRGTRGESFLFEEGETWVRVPWHVGWPIHVAVLGLLVLSSIWMVVPGERGVSRFVTGRTQRWLLRGIGLCNLVFLFGMGTFFAITMAQDGGSLRTHVPWTLWLLLSLPWLSMVLAAASIVSLLRSARRQPGSSWPLAAAYLSLVAFVVWLGFWNLLGLQV